MVCDIYQQWFNAVQMDSADPTKVRFHSNLLAGFGVGLFTPINTIDFGTVFNNIGDKLIESVPIWGTIIVIIIAYIPFAVLARRADKNDVVKVNVVLAVLPVKHHFNTAAYHFVTPLL